MELSPAGIDLIKGFEGLQLKPYKCPAGVWTIGYGHTAGVKETSAAITETQAVNYLKEDVQGAEDTVRRLVNVPLTQNQFDALVSFVFNIGETQFASSTMLTKLKGKDYAGAAEEFDRWKFAGGKVLNGLVNRRAKEKQFFSTN
jgi:lysozyme